MRRALEYVKAFDGVIAQHAQEPRLTEGAQLNEGEVASRLGLAGWPAAAEEAIIARDCLLAAHVDAALHVCHVSTAGSVDIIRWAKSKGWRVTAEVTPHHLLLTDDLAGDYDPVFKVNPPLRTRADVDALRAALADGTIDCVATDHAPHPVEAKETEWAAAANGMTGLETALRVVQRAMVDTGLLDWAGVADRMSARPAAIGRVSGHGQPLAAGAAANLTLYDAAAPATPGGPGRARLQEPQQPVRRDGAARPGARDVPARHGDGPRRKGDPMTRREPGRHAGARGRHDAARQGVRRLRRVVRRDGVQHRHDRLPGDAHRPVVLRPDRGDDRPAHRQHRRQRRGPGEPPHLGQRLRGPRAVADRLELAGPAEPGGRAEGAGDHRHRGAGHPRADHAAARARRDAGGRVHRRGQPGAAARARPGQPGHDRRRPGADRHHAAALHGRPAGRRRGRGTGSPPWTSASRTPRRATWPTGAWRCGCSRPPSTAKDILATDPDGVFFSNGPGDPAAAGYAVTRDARRPRRGRAAVRHLLRQPDPVPGGRPRHLQAPLRPPGREPAGHGPGQRPGLHHQPQPRLRGRAARGAARRTPRSPARPGVRAGRPTSRRTLGVVPRVTRRSARPTAPPRSPT